MKHQINKNSTAYTFFFALTVCVVCSVALALVSEGLSDRRGLNEMIDAEKNILKAVKIEKPVLPHEIMRVYQEKIAGLVVNAAGDVVAGESPDEIEGREGLYPLYVYKENGQVKAYCFPVSGEGLWGMIYGYLALERDAATIRGISFYKHQETPGLGGEIESAWFQKNFEGKKIYDVQQNRIRPVRVVKGRAADQINGRDLMFAVDGITGATMTSRGVDAFLDHWIRVYEPYFKKIRKDININK